MIASTCWRVLFLACFVGPALLEPAVVAGFATLADRVPAVLLFAVLYCAAVLVAFDEVDLA